MDNLILTTIPEKDFLELISTAIRSEMATFQSQVSEPAQDEYLTRKQTASKLQVSLVTLHQWTKTGTLKGYRIGARVRYKLIEVEHALKAMRTIKQ